MIGQIRRRLLESLKKVDRPGTFCTSGRLPATLPGLEVAGLGSVALPLDKRQATALKKLSRQAPYGKGLRTLVDTDVRRVWEIDAAQVSTVNPEWASIVARAVMTAQSDLGLEKQQLDAHLYKLLLYERGSFFLPHRDGEKLDRMVATLVIALPSAHEGGELIVRHEGRETTVDFSPEGRFQTQFAAFYADCEHEVRPVTSGFRLALVYNLTLAKSKQAVTAPTSGEHIEAVAGILQTWKDLTGQVDPAAHADREQPTARLAVVLDHQYSQAGLTYDALKGVDRAKADVLFAAARQTGCDASLALVTKWVSGSAEPSGDDGYQYGYGRSHRRGRDRHDDDRDEKEGDSGHEMGEVFDESLTVQHFSDAAGHRLAYGQFRLHDDEVVSHIPLGEGKPDTEDFEGYTGNAGMTLQRWYHRAAIVLWPAESRFHVLCQAGVKAAVGGLEQMIRQWKQARQDEQAALLPPCLEFARRIIAYWPQRNFAAGHFDAYEIGDDDDDEYFHHESADCRPLAWVPSLQASRGDSESSPRSLLSLLEELGDASLVAAWLRGVLARDVSVEPDKTLGDLCRQHGWTTFRDELQELFENTSHETLERHARLLADWSLLKDANSERERLCSQLAQTLISAVERWDPRLARGDWRARAVDRSALLLTLVQTFLALEEPLLLERLLTYIGKRPGEFDLTTVQIPALLSLETWLKKCVRHASPPLQRWLTGVVEELEDRRSRPPQEPADWRRESATGCDCDACRELRRFLEDPSLQTRRFPLPEPRRKHLHEVIDRKKLDTTHVTERRGRPYTLVCIKTKASYERAVQAHQMDLAHLEQVGQLLAWQRQLSSRPARPASGAPKATRKSRT